MSSLHFVVSIGEGDQLNDRWVEKNNFINRQDGQNVESGNFSPSFWRQPLHTFSIHLNFDIELHHRDMVKSSAMY